MRELSVGSRLRVEVKHRRPAPKRYTWEIRGEHDVLPMEESPEQFGSWEEASQAGKNELKKIAEQS